uniref:Uncharacterized protein n=1 Tax=Cannabis sativa TaxID=3483 RepID=A0A803PQF3_CANSA
MVNKIDGLVRDFGGVLRKEIMPSILAPLLRASIQGVTRVIRVQTAREAYSDALCGEAAIVAACFMALDIWI